MQSLFKRISEQWFLREPAFFSLYCTHELKENLGMKCPFRSGKHRIEYNPALLRGHSQTEIEMALRVELMRLFLKHPYDRQPADCSQEARRLGSDCCLTPSLPPMSSSDPVFQYARPSDFQLKEDQYFEWYARRIEEQLEDESESQDDRNQESGQGLNLEATSAVQHSRSDSAALWMEDAMAVQEINDLIKTLNNWGTIPGDVVQRIVASTQSRIDYRLIMQGFRGHILSSKRRLTRMRPNRRTGFDQMGSQRRFDTRLLVAVDVSGSISDRTLTHFYGVINRFFRYGIDQIDCVQFDCELRDVLPLHKASRQVDIKGRGGTSFQPIFDYVLEHNVYDGIVILTDGGAPHPVVDAAIKARVLWICEDEHSYNTCHEWMQCYGRVCWMTL